MRIAWQMRALPISAIVAALMLAGCGQRGPLYLPEVPPLPPKPIERAQPPADAADAASSDDGSAADSPLALSPELSAQRASKAMPASGASSAQ
ncbi:LPS translocon maturation chaperone LptM [Burkholderia singularis]|uniref:LPS translocon maturation chaperone LptM n=1 Tax=Burkholderia singularis TaxID=1503053 RepID=UPI00075AC329|nr:lipoprotein [Burkholderia singularis]